MATLSLAIGNTFTMTTFNTTAVIAASAIVCGLCNTQAAQTSIQHKGETKMQYVTLNNGMVVPQLGFGTWTLKGEAAKESVKRAFEKNDPETFPW